jgi:hypothetical protein
MVSEPSGMVGNAEIDRRLGYHPATVETIPLYEANRAAAVAWACHIDSTCPPGRELALALTAVQESLMWANAAVACNLAPLEDPTGRQPNPLVQQMATDQFTKTLTVGVAIPDGLAPDQVVAIVAEELRDRLHRSAAERSPSGPRPGRPRVKDAPQA